MEDTTASSSVSSESAVSEESTSEAESQAEQEETINTVAEVEEAQSEEAETPMTVEEEKAEVQAAYDAETEAAIQDYMSAGLTREEAIDRLERVRSEVAAKQEQVAKNQAAEREKMEQEKKEVIEKSDKFIEETYGVTFEEWSSMSSEEQYRLAYERGV